MEETRQEFREVGRLKLEGGEIEFGGLILDAEAVVVVDGHRGDEVVKCSEELRNRRALLLHPFLEGLLRQPLQGKAEGQYLVFLALAHLLAELAIARCLALWWVGGERLPELLLLLSVDAD